MEGGEGGGGGPGAFHWPFQGNHRDIGFSNFQFHRAEPDGPRAAPQRRFQVVQKGSKWIPGLRNREYDAVAEPGCPLRGRMAQWTASPDILNQSKTNELNVTIGKIKPPLNNWQIFQQSSNFQFVNGVDNDRQIFDWRGNTWSSRDWLSSIWLGGDCNASSPVIGRSDIQLESLFKPLDFFVQKKPKHYTIIINKSSQSIQL